MMMFVMNFGKRANVMSSLVVASISFSKIKMLSVLNTSLMAIYCCNIAATVSDNIAATLRQY